MDYCKKNELVKIDNEKELIKSISKSLAVVGHNSMALVVANICGVPAIHVNASKKLCIPKFFLRKILSFSLLVLGPRSASS